jgi:hypothetical protein
MEALLKLRRYLEEPGTDSPQAAAPKEVCELCSAQLGAEHGHVIDIRNRRLMCACRPCYLLFTNPAAAGGNFRSTGSRYVNLGGEAAGAWEALDMPVGMAFFVRNSAQARVVAFYPSPAGATESGIPLETWQEIVESMSALESLEPDIEAVLVRRRGREEAWIVPVDACYELVGRIRRCWSGFDGGPDAWREIDGFFDGLAAHAAGGHA